MPGRAFSLPPFLQGLLTSAEYCNWVRVKAWALFKRDRKRNLPPALTSSIAVYKETVNNAVAASGPFDPYTGDRLRWSLIGTWNPARAKTDCGYVRTFYRMPTVDHVDPYGKKLAFEICSWEVNCCKSFLNPNEFIDQCNRIVAFRANRKQARPSCDGFPAVYLLPPFLEGVCTLPQYDKWLLERAKELYKRDKAMQRACALGSSRSLYRKAIHAAVCASGPLDPYTGDRLAWDRICTWDAAPGFGDHDIFKKEFALLPTVDHTDPAAKELSFEICSWRINCCKSGRTPEEFVALCERVEEYARRSASR